MSEFESTEFAARIPLARLPGDDGKDSLAVVIVGSSEEAVEAAVKESEKELGPGRRVTFDEVIDRARVEDVTDMEERGVVSFFMSSKGWNAPWQPSGEQARKIEEGRRQARLRRQAENN